MKGGWGDTVESVTTQSSSRRDRMPLKDYKPATRLLGIPLNTACGIAETKPRTPPRSQLQKPIRER